MMNDTQVTDRLKNISENLELEEAHIQRMLGEIETLESLLSPKAARIIRDLRPMVVADNVYNQMEQVATTGERLADRITRIAGSWGFISTFVVCMVIWIGLNTALGPRAFDTYPYILLNLALSTLAAIQAPIILMSQNRQAAKDRAVAENDYQVNLKSELEIADLHRKIDILQGIINQQHQLIQQMLPASPKATNQTDDVKP